MAIATVQAVINGQTHTLTWNGTSGKYEATITAPATTSYGQPNNVYDVAVTATDVAGNATTKDSTDPTLGSSLALAVKEKVAPTITIVSPGAGSKLTNNKPTVTFQLRDSGSGIKIASLAFKIDGGTSIAYNGTGMTASTVAGGYDCTFVVQTALGDGNHTFTVDVQDNDLNVATQASRTVTVDTVAPTLNVTAPSDNLITKTAAQNVTGITSDLTSSPVTVTVKLNNVDQGVVTIDGGGNFSKAITLANGSNTIIVTATDGAGKYSTVTRTVTLDTTPPTITLVEITPNPVDAGATYVIKVTVTD